MKKLYFGITTILILPLFLIFLTAEIKIESSKTLVKKLIFPLHGKTFDDFQKKSYYTKIFSSTQIKTLSEVQAANLKTKKDLSKAEEYFSKAENFKKIVELSPSDSDRKKAAKKADKFDKKGSQAGVSALDPSYNANLLKYAIYLKQLQEIKNDGSPEHKTASDLLTEATSIFDKARDLYKNSQKSEGLQKYTLLKEAIETQNIAFDKQESAFGYFMHDPEFKVETKNIPVVKDTAKIVSIVKDTHNVVKKDTNTVSNKNKKDVSVLVSEKYNSAQDSNLYVSKLPVLTQKIGFSPQDQQILIDFLKKINQANLIQKRTEKLYSVVDSLHEKAAAEPNKKVSEQITQQAVTIEKDVFDSLLVAADLYLQANESQYQIYLKYLGQYRTNDSETGKKYETSADDCHDQIQSLTADANLQSYNHEKYIKLMNADFVLLSAIRQLENAYCVYFKLPESPITEPETYKNEEKNVVIKNGNQNKNKNGSENKINNKKTDTYSFAGTYIYGNENPSPVLITHKKGVIFKVQIGVFKDLLPLKTFSEFSPISFDSYKNTQLKRFMLGEYRSDEAAELALNRVKEKGFPEAFIVSYVDGVRNSYTYGKSQLKRDDDYKKTSENEVNWFKNLPISYNNDKTITEKDNKQQTFHYGTGPYDFAKGTDISTVKGFVYTVQIGLFQLPRTNEEIKLLSPLYNEKVKDGTKYLINTFQNFEEASKEKNKIANLGFREAFVCAYLDGKQISLTKAEKYGKKTIVPVTKDEIFFQVQIGAYASKLPSDKEKSYLALSKTNPVTAKTDENGLVIYTVGKTKSYSEAIQLKNSLKKQGFNDGFVVAFKNGKKIKVLDAVKLLSN
jgi:hypothetical protein